MRKLEEITVLENDRISIPAETFDVIAQAARLKYRFRGSSKRTIKKYVIRYIEEAIIEYAVAEGTR